MPNYKIRIEYDGTSFFGWQSQPDGNTIQDNLTSSIKTICREDISLIGSGRTDAGVHALGQVANFSTSSDLNLFRFKYALNSVLPPSIAVKTIEQVDDSFHSRFDAKKRIYYYLLTKEKSAFYFNFSYFYKDIKKLDIGQLNQISSELLGEHDFTSFCKTKTDTENKICSISNLQWRELSNLVVFRIEANRFLHGMVRTIVGTLLESVLKNNPIEHIKEVIDKKDRDTAGKAVPAKGLFLYNVKY